MSDSEEYREDGQAIMIDNGSSAIRAGFSGDDAPRSQFINEISRKNALSLKYPIEHGIIVHWNEFEQVWKHAEHAIILSEIPCNPTPNREKLTTIMFEKFNTPSMYLAVDAVLTQYASGGTTGTVVDCGYARIRSSSRRTFN
eukprot:418240_1